MLEMFYRFYYISGTNNLLVTAYVGALSLCTVGSDTCVRPAYVCHTVAVEVPGSVPECLTNRHRDLKERLKGLKVGRR